MLHGCCWSAVQIPLRFDPVASFSEPEYWWNKMCLPSSCRFLAATHLLMPAFTSARSL